MADVIILTNTDGIIWQRSIGAYQVANHCRQNNITCQVIDFTESFKKDELYQIIKKFIGQNTLVLGVSTTFYNAENKTNLVFTDGTKIQKNNPITENIEHILTTIKTEYPYIKIIGGGANSYHIKDNKLFDVVLHGYSESAFVNYVQTLNGKRKIYPTINGVTNIDGATEHFDIENLQHTWVDNDCVLENETLPIEISRGCIFKCKFCSYPLNGKKKFDYLRSPECIKNELIDNYKKYGTTNYFFTDDTFNDSTHKLKLLHEVFTSLPFKIKFVTYLRLDLLYRHPEQIRLLKEMGLGSAFFGIETFNSRAGKIIGKGMPSDKIKTFLVDLHDNLWEGEIPFTLSFIVGLPHETKESVESTVNWLKDKPFQDLWFPLRIQTKTHFKSEFDVNYEKYGYSLNEDGTWTSKLMTYAEANALAEKYNNEGFYGNKPPSSWFLFGVLSHGYQISDFRNIPNNELPWKTFIRQKRELFKKYKEKLEAL